MRMQKRQFRIGDLAKQLDIEKFVIRFWEKEFAVNTTRSIGGQRFYSQEDLDRFQHIKTLLYDEGFTIAGAKKHLKSSPMVVGSHKTTMQADTAPIETPCLDTTVQEQLRDLKIQLIKLRELL
ncbi:MAG: MerR family transcriptional regulator [Candidatus Babeliales bacterium]